MNPAHQGYLQTFGDLNAEDNTVVLNTFSGHGVQITTPFKPGNVFDGKYSDMAIKSPDDTEFYIHRQQLARASSNAFAGLLTIPAFSISILEPAVVLNIVFHTVYGMPCTHYNPSLDIVEAAIGVLIKYGIAPHPYASSSQPLYQLLLSHAPFHPIDAYAVAGKYGFEDAAVAISGHLLTYDLSRISDALSIKMTPVYLRRLVDLHHQRAEALKTIVMPPPGTHPQTWVCGGADESRLTNAWAYAVAQLAWAALPGMSTHALRSALEKAGAEVAREECRAALHARIQEVCWRWSEVKTTI